MVSFKTIVNSNYVGFCMMTVHYADLFVGNNYTIGYTHRPPHITNSGYSIETDNCIFLYDIKRDSYFAKTQSHEVEIISIIDTEYIFPGPSQEIQNQLLYRIVLKAQQNYIKKKKKFISKLLECAVNVNVIPLIIERL